jgi:hypothetical protein
MIGILLLVLTLAVQLAMKRTPKIWLVGAVLGAAIGIVVMMAGVVGVSGLLMLVGIGALITVTVGFMTPRLTPRLAFEPTHQHDHIALDASGRVWVRDESGQEVILNKDDIEQWTHHYVANGQYRARNRIELRTRDLNRPVVSVRFKRHPDTVWGAPRNASEAAEWHARLSALLHH